jgi:PIN domain nuclease of toxin-antitoxin system
MLEPQRLSRRASAVLADADAVCSDISLWEVAMLAFKGRISVGQRELPLFLHDLTAGWGTIVLPITPEIAALAYAPAFSHGDPADRIIAATAMAHGAPLITEDRLLHGVEGLTAVW